MTFWDIMMVVIGMWIAEAAIKQIVRKEVKASKNEKPGRIQRPAQK